MIVDLGPVIDAEGVFVSLKQKSGGSYNADGDWASEIVTSSTIVAVIQPAMGTKLLDLPEGEREQAKYFLWTRSSLALDDVVNYGGSDYRVSFVWPRPEGGFIRAALGLMA